MVGDLFYTSQAHRAYGGKLCPFLFDEVALGSATYPRIVFFPEADYKLPLAARAIRTRPQGKKMPGPKIVRH